MSPPKQAAVSSEPALVPAPRQLKAMVRNQPPVLGTALGPDRRSEALSLAATKLQSREAYAERISQLWERAQQHFLTIGRYLIYAKETLPHGEFEQMISTELPFGRNVAHQLRSATETVQSGRLPSEAVPSSYSTVYLLSTLNDSELQLARAEGLLRPTVRRSEIVAFKRRLAGTSSPEGVALEATLEKLLRERRRLDQEIATIGAKLREARGESEQEGPVIDGHAEKA